MNWKVFGLVWLVFLAIAVAFVVFGFLVSLAASATWGWIPLFGSILLGWSLLIGYIARKPKEDWK